MGEKRSISVRPVRFGGSGRTNHSPTRTMTASAKFLDRGSRGSRGSRGPRGPRRSRGERRTLTRLRKLCEEVLASYRAARGDDVVTEADRRAADDLLAKLSPGATA